MGHHQQRGCIAAVTQVSIYFSILIVSFFRYKEYVHMSCDQHAQYIYVFLLYFHNLMVYVLDVKCVPEILDYSIYRWRWLCDVLVFVRYSYWTMKHVRQFFKLVIRKAIRGLFYLSYNINALSTHS